MTDVKKAFRAVATGLFFAGVLGIAGCESRNVLDSVSDTLEVDVGKGAVLSESDSHGGFQGDGTAYAVISFSDADCLNQIVESAAWRPLPLSEHLTALIYGQEGENGKLGPMLCDRDGEPLPPRIQNGYYCFVDRHPLSQDKKDDSDVFSRSSYNFSVGIYDTDTDTLYYMELDT